MQNYKKLIILGLGVIVTQAVIGVANAGTPQQPDETVLEKPAMEKPVVDELGKETTALFQKLDVDKNKLISLKEASAHASLLKQFNTLDVDEDGNLTLTEMGEFDIAKV